MRIPDKYTVRSIDTDQTKEWLLYKHYAKRLCPISYAFGLFFSDIMVGCCVFGVSANRNNLKIGKYSVMELNRLVINDGLDKNVLSFFVSSCLKKMPRPLVILSYADPNNGHHGYIYQATNWFYLGQGQRKDGGWDTGVTAFKKDGKEYHAKSVSIFTGGSTSKDQAIKYGFERTFTPPKHKYIYYVGSRSQIKNMVKETPYKFLPYPKGDNKRYDSSYKPTVQGQLF